jgi:hypothetical protein
LPPDYRLGMTSKDDERARRLAEALRDNLKRRKSQSRGRDAEADGEGITPGAAEPSTPPRSRP